MLHERPTRQMGQAFIREAARIRNLNHDNVVRLLAVHFRTNPLLIVLEFMSLGDLKSLLRQLRPGEDTDVAAIGLGTLCLLDELMCDTLCSEHLLKFSLDVACGFQYLQSCRYVHRDIAARNVLVSGACQAKIGDFGLCCMQCCISSLLMMVAGMARRLYNTEVCCLPQQRDCA